MDRQRHSGFVQLTQEQQALAELGYELGKRFEDRRFDDLAATAEQWELVRKAGITGLAIPPRYGGDGDLFDLCLAIERIAAGGLPCGRLVISQGVAASILAGHGSDAQRAEWLPRIADGSARFCFAMTEAGAGSNLNRMKTRARRTAEGWSISGEKTYISAIDDSEAVVLAAKDEETGGITLFLLPLPHPGIALTPVELELATFERQWTVHLDNVSVGADAVVGTVGAGNKALFDGLNPERLAVAGQAIGMGRWSLAKGIEHAKSRVVFDVPIGQHQGVQHPLAEAWVRLEAAWMLTQRAAEAAAAGIAGAGTMCNAAKVAACDAGLAAADAALQAFGGSGFTSESMVYQRYAHLRLNQTVPVARELALNHIASSALGLPRSY
ncbi:acyl-CoA dehydrogenase family protein [Nocardia harenae]|uniref:acyl-CoA dehydrogenase family protein n=1 Tax=Nocardia harenae TaxID=358707 RepID=UPI00083764C1|nr:acyl-CoA dehydrogenase family protein [Nocardia harenae]